MGVWAHFSSHTCWCLAGLAVSWYALYVEYRHHLDPEGYHAMCDLGEHASCSRVLSSEYGQGFGLIPRDSALCLPNCLYGIFFYALQLYLGSLDNQLCKRVAFINSLCSGVVSIYLAYILAFKLKDFCLVCITTYGVNVGLIYTTYHSLHPITPHGKTS